MVGRRSPRSCHEPGTLTCAATSSRSHGLRSMRSSHTHRGGSPTTPGAQVPSCRVARTRSLPLPPTARCSHQHHQFSSHFSPQASVITTFTFHHIVHLSPCLTKLFCVLPWVLASFPPVRSFSLFLTWAGRAFIGPSLYGVGYHCISSSRM